MVARAGAARGPFRRRCLCYLCPHPALAHRGCLLLDGTLRAGPDGQETCRLRTLLSLGESTWPGILQEPVEPGAARFGRSVGTDAALLQHPGTAGDGRPRP